MKQILEKTHWQQSFAPTNAAYHMEFLDQPATPPAGVQIHQVHGREVVDAQAATPSTPADGLWTKTPDLPLVIKTADCLPLLIGSPQFVSAVHAGWRGLAAGIVEEANQFTLRQNQSLSQVMAFIGPCISSAQFEVGPEVIAAFKEPAAMLSPDEHELCTTKGAGDRWHFDLRKACIFQLVRLGVSPQNIYVHTDCTYTNPKKWSSYRRDGAKAGRIYSVITLK